MILRTELAYQVEEREQCDYGECQNQGIAVKVLGRWRKYCFNHWGLYEIDSERDRNRRRISYRRVCAVDIDWTTLD